MDVYDPIFWFDYPLARQTDTQSLGRQLAKIAQAGDIIALEGDLGTGKTTLARALIEERYHQAGLSPQPVTSPTFNLVHIYDPPPCPVWHLDLYRLQTAREADELGWEEARDTKILIIEWPEILADQLPADRLSLRLGHSLGPDSHDSRSCRIFGSRHWETRLPIHELRGNPRPISPRP